MVGRNTEKRTGQAKTTDEDHNHDVVEDATPSLRHWHTTPSGKRTWLSHLASLLALIVLSFGMLWVSSHLNTESLAVTRYLASTYAPVSGIFYPPGTPDDAVPARDRIKVLLYDNVFLDQQGASWPLKYAQYADELLRIAQSEEHRPKAIFIDLTFEHERRDDPTISEFREALCQLRDWNVPVFIAGVVAEHSDRFITHSGLFPPRPETPAPPATDAAADPTATPASAQGNCFVLVGADAIHDPVDRRTWTYPLAMRWDHPSDTIVPATDGVSASYHMAALRLAMLDARVGPAFTGQAFDAAGMSPATTDSHAQPWPGHTPMALVWGTRTPRQDGVSQYTRIMRHQLNCRDDSGGSTWQEIWQQLPSWRSRQDIDPYPNLCPYHETLSMQAVLGMDETALASHLKDRYVMIGLYGGGLNDMAISPVHQQIPGIYVHAMALDNLLTYGADYPRQESWSQGPSWQLILSTILAISIVYVIHRLFSWLRWRITCNRWLQQHLGICLLTEAQFYASPFWRRLAHAPLRVLFWVLRIALQTGLALALISLLQHLFNVSMLPAVEVVSMTLLAEALQLMTKLRQFLFGTSTPPAPPPASQEIAS